MIDTVTEHLAIRALGGPHREAGLWGLVHRQENTATYLGWRPFEGHVWRIEARAISGDDAVVEHKTTDGATIDERVVQSGELLGIFEAVADSEEDVFGVLAQLALSGMKLTATDEPTQRELISLLRSAGSDESWAFAIGVNRYRLTSHSRETLRQIAEALESGQEACAALPRHTDRTHEPSVTILGHPHTIASIYDVWNASYSNELWRDVDRITPKYLSLSSFGREFDVILERDGDTWVSYVPRLNDLSTYGDSRDDVIAYTEEAIRGYLKALEKEKLPLPNVEHVRPATGQESIRLRIPTSTR